MYKNLQFWSSCYMHPKSIKGCPNSSRMVAIMLCVLNLLLCLWLFISFNRDCSNADFPSYRGSFLYLRETQNALLFPVFSFFMIFYHPYPGLWNWKSVFLILKILQYGGLRRPMITKSGQQVHL